MAARPLPNEKTVMKILTELLGKKVVARRGSAFFPRPGLPATVALFGNAQDPARTAILCDMGQAITLGAALSMIPPAVAAQHVKAAKMDQNLLENFQEVMNICAGLFNPPGHSRVGLKAIHVAPPPIPKNIALLLIKPAARMDLETMIQGYQAKGKLTLIAAP